MPLELLAPAKNLDFGREAINHGADAVYIGAPAYGARAAATNSMADIEALVRYAHLYRAKVYATLNTLLFNHEVEDAARVAKQLYEAGVDALIVQDMGLLECDLPPIALHASTQCHNASVERIKFLEQVGFERVILARETSIAEMQTLRQAVSVELEAFVHGALCVSYSGQCYLSQYLTGRSGNRGCCSQPCRSAYDLVTADGRELLHNRHLLSLKDFDASRYVAAMADAGVCSLKIEGRLKDLNYVKNITAHYRQLIDRLPASRPPASSGHCHFSFQPDPTRTFNRGYTDYFLAGRHHMATLDTQKAIGKPIGKVLSVGRKSLVVSGEEPVSAGDGLCFFDQRGKLQGFLVNSASDNTLIPNIMPPIAVGTHLWRNQDHDFERQLAGKSAERKIGVALRFITTENGFAVAATDEDGQTAECTIEATHTASNNADNMSEQIVRQLGKLGDTPFVATHVEDATAGRYFLPTSALNRMRREVAYALTEHRISHFRPSAHLRTERQAPCPTPTLDYRANIINDKAEIFYKRHGASKIERGLEQTGDYDGKALMTTKYCLRHELDCCLQGKGQSANPLHVKPTDTLLLRNNDRLFRLAFDCRHCQMMLFKH